MFRPLHMRLTYFHLLLSSQYRFSVDFHRASIFLLTCALYCLLLGVIHITEVRLKSDGPITVSGETPLILH
jgi:hypothetical protein